MSLRMKAGIMHCIGIILVLIPAWACAQNSPEPATGYTNKDLVVSKNYMAVSANPLAAKAGAHILEAGGNAVDSTIAMQMVLNVVEPQSSGIGGGGFLLYYDAMRQKTTAYDARETAPQDIKDKAFLNTKGQPISLPEALKKGDSVGVPGILKMLKQLHEERGDLAWKDLFEPAIILADQGFEVSSRLDKELQSLPYIFESKPVAKLFMNDNGLPKHQGDVLVNKELAETLRIIANEGISSFYQGDIAHAIAATVQSAGGSLRIADLNRYAVKKSPALCKHYRDYQLCTMSSPVSGGIVVLETMGILEFFDLHEGELSPAQKTHIMVEAFKLALADRSYYMADPDFVSVPVSELLSDEYLRQRAALIDPDHAAKSAQPGELGKTFAQYIPDQEPLSTTHMSVVDNGGNAVSFTSSIEQPFGSTLMVKGFLLNNHMTDFAFVPKVNHREVANRIQPGKRPRSAMSPIMVFDHDDQLVMTLGSPGGPRIITYVVQTLVDVLDSGMDIQTAINQPHFANLNTDVTELEKDRSWKKLAKDLKKLGHHIEYKDLNSGLHGIMLKNKKLYGGADPRREGKAIGG